MVSIISSKLYKAHPRKDKILAALADPVNMELVTQLRDYLDEPKKYEPNLDMPDGMSGDLIPSGGSGSDMSSGGGAAKGPGGAANRSSRMPGPSGTYSGGTGMTPGEFGAGTEPADPDPAEPADDVADVPPADEPSEDVESGLDLDVVDDAEVDLDSLPESLKGTLNDVELTAGVTRITIKNKDKDPEVWIHYNDSVNLNNVMSDVIEQIDVAGYHDFTFSRLARTNNAIVFDTNIKNKEDSDDGTSVSEIDPTN